MHVAHVMQNQVVPGDVVVIAAGDQVPADLRVFEATNLKVAEDSLTGESNPVAKRSDAIPGGKAIGLGDRKNCCYSATNVQAGKGKGIAIATGTQAQIGKINSLVTEAGAKKEHTNLEIQLEIFGRYVAAFTLIVAAVAFAIAWKIAGEDVGTAFKSAVAIAVAIIPEGLPAVVTICLALAMKLLADNNAIVKKLPSVETLGSVTVICSDKTGTLTKNEMTVTRIQTKAAQYPVKGVGYDPNAGTVIDPQTGNDLPAEHINRSAAAPLSALFLAGPWLFAPQHRAATLFACVSSCPMRARLRGSGGRGGAFLVACYGPAPQLSREGSCAPDTQACAQHGGRIAKLTKGDACGQAAADV